MQWRVFPGAFLYPVTLTTPKGLLMVVSLGVEEGGGGRTIHRGHFGGSPRPEAASSERSPKYPVTLTERSELKGLLRPW